MAIKILAVGQHLATAGLPQRAAAISVLLPDPLGPSKFARFDSQVDVASSFRACTGSVHDEDFFWWLAVRAALAAFRNMRTAASTNISPEPGCTRELVTS